MCPSLRPRSEHAARLALAFSLIAVLVLGAALQPRPAAAATCVVTNTNNDGEGSLRAAIDNTDGFSDCSTITFSLPGAGPWTIRFDGALVFTQRLLINRNLTITGPGADRLTIDGDKATSVFIITAGTVASISGLTITNGDGRTYLGGGIYNLGTLSVARSVIYNNSTDDVGGGILNEGGTLTVTDSTFSGNAASGLGGSLMRMVAAGSPITEAH